MDSALRRIQALAGGQRAETMEPFFERLNRMPGVNRPFKRIALAQDVQQLDDYRAEILYALMFAGLAFDVAIEPKGAEGPDLSVCRDGYSASVEVTRFRKVHEGPPTASLSDLPKIFPAYGDPIRDVRKVYEKVGSKFRQLKEGTGIVAIWNDDGALEDLEACQGVAEIAHDAVTGVLAAPPDVFLVIYASEWTNISRCTASVCGPTARTISGDGRKSLSPQVFSNFCNRPCPCSSAPGIPAIGSQPSSPSFSRAVIISRTSPVAK